MKAINVMIAEDDLRIRQLVMKYLKNEGYKGIEAENGQQALDIIEEERVDVVILDVMMPVMDGWSTLRAIKQSDPNIPVIMLTARGEEQDKLFGFDLGVDDYLTKPFSVKELMARVRALLKRVGYMSASETIEIGNISIDTKAHTVHISDVEVAFTSTEYELIIYFINNIKRTLSREQIIDHIWGMNYFGDFRTVDTHIKRLRKKLIDSGFKISTVRGIGYKGEQYE